VQEGSVQESGGEVAVGLVAVEDLLVDEVHGVWSGGGGYGEGAGEG